MRPMSTWVSRSAVVFLILMPLLVGVWPAAGEAPVIRSGSEPVQGSRRLGLVEQWRVGGDEGSFLFGIISGVAADDAGRIYLADWQLCQIFVLDAEGKLLGTLSREGDGPGEIRHPSDVMILPEGRIGILHQVRDRITCLNSDGTPAAEILLRGPQSESPSSMGMMRADRRGPSLAVEGFQIDFGDDGRKETRYLRVYDLEGRQRYEVYARIQRAFDFERKTFTERLGYNGVWALGPDGSLYLAPERDLYRIEQWTPDGTLARVIERDHVVHRRTAKEKEAAAGGASMSINGQRVPLQCDIEDRPPCIAQIAVDGESGLWVIHSESRLPAAADPILSYDHFDASGRYLERVEVADPSDPDRDQLIMLDPRRFVLLRRIGDAWDAYAESAEGEAEESDADPLEVVYYRVAD